MEDIDKNGDGFIDLEEYIGETLLLLQSPLCLPSGSRCHHVLPTLPLRKFSSLNFPLPAHAIEGSRAQS